MTTPATQHSNSPAATVLDAAASAVEHVLAFGQGVLGRAELHVHAWRMGRDEGTAAWVREFEQRGSTDELPGDAISPAQMQAFIDATRDSP